MATVWAAETVEDVAAPSPARRRRLSFTRLAAAVGLALLAGFLVVTAIMRAPQFSLLDEATHADYAYRVAHRQLPADGDVLSPAIREEWSCHGSSVGTRLPPCGEPAPVPGRYPNRGENYNAFHPPLYYLVTGLTARALDVAIPGAAFVNAARLGGLGWLLAAMAVLYLAVRRLGGSAPLAALGAGLLPLTPIVLHASSTVTNDAPAALAGSLALLVLARVVVGRRTGWLVPAVTTLLVTATKVLNALPMLVVAGLLAALAVRRWRGDRPAARSLAVAAATIVASFALVYLGWSAIQAGRGLPGWVNPVAGVSGRVVVGLPVNEILSTSFSGFGLTSSYFLQKAINGAAITAWAKLLTALVTAAPFMALAVHRRWRPGWLVGAGLLAGMLLYPLAVEVQVYLSSGLYFPAVVVRYGMSFIPWAVAALALIATLRRAHWPALVVTALGAGLVGATVSGLL